MSRQKSWKPSKSIPGRAMCANFVTFWSVPSLWLVKAPSKWPICPTISAFPPAQVFEPDCVRLPVGTTVSEAEKALIQLTLQHTKNNKTQAAEILGISLKTLFNKLKEYGAAEAQEGAESGAKA